MSDFLARLKWQWLRRRFGSSSESEKVSLSTTTPSYMATAARTSGVVEQVCPYSRAHFEARKSTCWPFMQFGCQHRPVPVKIEALRWIQQSLWVPLPTDEDGGYCLVEKALVQEAQESILARSWYEQIHVEIAVLYQTACIAYRKLANQIASTTECLALYSQICKSLMGCPRKDLPRKLSLTVKTHKPPGEISFRNLHVGGPQPFGGLSAWLNIQLDKVLKRLPHVMTSTHDLANKLQQVEIDFPIGLARIDVKDFFMSGTCTDFVTCAGLLPLKERQNVVDAIQFLCNHQFLVADAVPHTLWQVKTGTGVGLIHSSQLCDLAYYMHAEHQLVDTTALAFFGVAKCLRFRGDILILYNAEGNQLARFAQLLKCKARYVQVQVESFSEETAVVLDLHVHVRKHKQDKWSLEFFPHFKPTSLQVPPSCSS